MKIIVNQCPRRLSHVLLTVVVLLVLTFTQSALWAQSKNIQDHELDKALLRAKDNCLHDFTIGYTGWTTRFNRELSGRFPFAPLDSPDANLESVKSFFTSYSQAHDKLISTFLCAGMPYANTLNARNALKWMHQMKALSDWGLSQQHPQRISFALGGITPLIDELGRSQIVAVALNSGTHKTRYPNGIPNMPWVFGEPLILDFIWASGSGWRPESDPKQPRLVVQGDTASFTFEGDWSLLRLLFAHNINHSSAKNETVFVVPIKRQDGAMSQAQLKVIFSINLDNQLPAFARVAPLLQNVLHK